MANLIPKNDWLNAEDLFGQAMKHFWDDRQLNVDVQEYPDRYEITADLPGFAKEEIEIEYNHDTLSISAEHKTEKEEQVNDGRYLRKERSASSVQRHFSVKDIKEDQIKASFDNGVLSLNLPKAGKTDQQTKKITID